MKISVDKRVLQFGSGTQVKTLRGALLKEGIYIDGLTSDSGFAIKGDSYEVHRETTSDGALRWNYDSRNKVITIYNPGPKDNPETEDRVRRIMFSALLQYDASQFYGQLNKKQEKPKEQPYRMAA